LSLAKDLDLGTTGLCFEAKNSKNEIFQKYFLSDREILYLENGLIKSYYFRFLEQSLYYLNNLDTFSISIPILIVRRTVNGSAGHMILCIIEKSLESYNVFIINSHPIDSTFDYGLEGIINYFLKYITDNFRPLKNIHKYGTFRCGTQLEDKQCVKHVAILIYNYINQGKPFQESQKLICPGYTHEQLSKFEVDPETKLRKIPKLEDGIKRIDVNDVLRLENITNTSRFKNTPLSDYSPVRHNLRRVFNNYQ
jgi:hypothetical protein